jgi:hypothetical protein
MTIDQKKLSAALNLKRLSLPVIPRVVGIEAESYVDSTGDDALRVWVFLDEQTDAETIPGQAVIRLKDAIHDSLLQHGITLFPYISLTKRSEQEITHAAE